MIAEKANEDVMKGGDRKKWRHVSNQREEQSSSSFKRQRTKMPSGSSNLQGNGRKGSRGSSDIPQCSSCQKSHRGPCPRVSGACFRCGQEGHLVKDCTKVAKDSAQVCYGCRQTGHQRKHCPKAAKDSAPVCFGCDQAGHLVKDCPKVAKDSAPSAFALVSVQKPTMFKSERRKELIPGHTSVTDSIILGNMERQAPCADRNINAYAASQLQQIDTQRIKQHAGMSNFQGRPESVPAEKEHPFVPSKVEGQWQWDRDAPRVSNPMSAHLYTEGQGGNATMLYQGQMPDPNVDLERTKEPRLQTHEQEMEIGYEDKLPPLTFESLEQKFLDENFKLEREQSDAEDAENAWHREKITGIKTQYQEKLSALRALQAKRREEFLLREARARLHQYQQAGLNHDPTNLGPIDPRGYSGAAATEAHRAYAASQFESYREGAPFLGGGGNQGTEARVPFPEGRVYNNTSARYY